MTKTEKLEALLDVMNNTQGADSEYSKTVQEAINAINSPDSLVIAFVQGCVFWNYENTATTMWPSSEDRCLDEALRRAAEGTLGKGREAEPPQVMCGE